jgi:hypothetical protein
LTKLFTIFILLTCEVCSGQNLVTNPSFEIYDTCPDFFSQISRANGWYSARPTADYFNTCSPYYPHPYTCVNVPYNSFGDRTPASGNAYVGVLGRVSGNEHRETIGSQLISPLQSGAKYFVSFKVSSGGQVNIYQWCGINKLGALFSTVKYDSLSPSPICSNCAQICSDSIITDTLYWTRITGSFVADSNYSFINIGRFNLNSLTDSIQIVGTSCYVYYFIDDVCVSTDSAYSYNYSYTGIENLYFDNSLSCFPNPFLSELNFQSTHNEQITIYFYDIFSRQILQQTFTNSTTVNTEQFANGLYIYEVRNKDGVIKKGKVIKQ